MSRRGKSSSRSLRHRVGHYFEFIALRMLLALLGRVPWGMHAPLAAGLARFFHHVLPLGRGAIRENLAVAFPEMSPAQHSRIILESYRHTVLLLLESARLPHATEEERHTCLVNEDSLQAVNELAQRPKGFIFMTAHIGNWEWLGAWYSQRFAPLGVVYKPLHNPRADALLRQTRQAVGMRTFSTRERTPREMIRHLNSGHGLAILPDQDAGRRGVYVDFFGMPASMALGPASLAMRFKLPVLPAFCLRTGPGKLRAVLGEVIWPDIHAADAEAEAVRIMGLYNRQLERVIREAPEQYFWWHRRWKSRPRAKDRVYAEGGPSPRAARINGRGGSEMTLL